MNTGITKVLIFLTARSWCKMKTDLVSIVCVYVFIPPPPSLKKICLFPSLLQDVARTLFTRTQQAQLMAFFLNKNISGYLVKEMSDILSILSFEFKVSYAHFSLE